jgi:hypothetical protein
MGRPEELPEDARFDLAVVPGADHGFAIARSAGLTEAEAMEVIVEATLEWVVREVVGAEAGNHSHA